MFEENIKNFLKGESDTSILHIHCERIKSGQKKVEKGVNSSGWVINILPILPITLKTSHRCTLPIT